MKLGYIYTVTSGGYDDDRVRINPGEWKSAVADDRQLWLKYAVGGESVAMTFVREGLVIAVALVTGGDRPDNNITTWVFVPAKIRISGQQIIKVIDEIKKINRGSTRNVSEASFRGNEILDMDYDEKAHSVKGFRSSGSALAARYPTVDFSLSDILGLPYQKYYAGYRYVFLLPSKTDIREGLQDLSDKDLVETIPVLPLSKAKIRETFGSETVSVRFADGNSFDSPIMSQKGRIYDLIAEKTECLPIQFKGQAVGEGGEIQISTPAIQWKRKITPRYFQVVDSKTGKSIVSNLNVDILDPDYDAINRAFPENRLNELRIRVSAKGYEPKEMIVDITQGPVPVTLERVSETMKYIYRKKNGDTVEITVNGPGAKSQTPIDGYCVVNGKLKYVASEPKTFGGDNGRINVGGGNNQGRRKNVNVSWPSFCYGAIAAVLVCACAYVCILLIAPADKEGDEKNANTEALQITADANNLESQSESASLPQPDNMTLAMAYLESCGGKLHRDSLEKNPETQGLFDDLNNFNLEEIKGKWNDKLGSNPYFKSIVNAATQSVAKRYDPKANKKNRTYNDDPNDNVISIVGWVNWVDGECAKQKQPESAPAKSAIEKNKGAKAPAAGKGGASDNNTSAPKKQRGGLG